MTKLGCNMTNKVSHIAAKFGHLSSNTFGVYSINILGKYYFKDDQTWQQYDK